MSLFKQLQDNKQEQLIFSSDERAGLKAITSVHDTRLGPAIGGIRVRAYADEREALTDSLRLAKGMTYKAAAAGLDFGGGSMVILGDSTEKKKERLLRAVGKQIETVGGRFIGIQDTGMSEDDMLLVSRETKWVAGLSPYAGGSGDPSALTAYGVYLGMKAAAKLRWGKESLMGRKVAVQGSGNVAKHLCKYLQEENARIYICDPNENKLKDILTWLKAVVVNPGQIYSLAADIFSPNASGSGLTEATLTLLHAKVIAGGANNQLADEQSVTTILKQKDILYVPDYIINAGGLIGIAGEIDGYHPKLAYQNASLIYSRVLEVEALARQNNISTAAAAHMLAERRLIEISDGKTYFPTRWPAGKNLVYPSSHRRDIVTDTLNQIAPG